MSVSGAFIWETETVLVLENVHASYGPVPALFGVDLEVGAGEVVTLMGRNGMGKTTTIRALFGLVHRTGRLRFDGANLDGLRPAAIAQLGVGLVPEGRRIFPNLTVTENLAIAAANRSGKAAVWTLERVMSLFPGLAVRRRAMGSVLSGGEQQMLAVGRALMTNPKLLILDEATEGLAPLIREEIWTCLASLRAHGQAILVIDKNIDRLRILADRHYVLERGRVEWRGRSIDLQEQAGRVRALVSV